jgi:hypothetical protein
VPGFVVGLPTTGADGFSPGDPVVIGIEIGVSDRDIDSHSHWYKTPGRRRIAVRLTTDNPRGEVMASLSPKDKKVLKAQIRSEVIRAPKSTKEKFCKAWPDAAKALQDLADLIKNPIVKGVIKFVIDLGNVVHDIVC